MEAILIDSNKIAKISTEGKCIDYILNYYQDTLGLHSYKKLIYKDIYPNIDWVIFFKNDNLEYEFILHHGGNSAQIKIRLCRKRKSDTRWKQQNLINDGRYYRQSMHFIQGERTVTTTYLLQVNIMQFNLANYD